MGGGGGKCRFYFLWARGFFVMLVTCETGLTSQRDTRGPIPQNCCGDCSGDCRGKSGCWGGVPGAVRGNCLGTARGTARGGLRGKTALALSSRQRAVSPGSLPGSSPWQFPIFPGSPPSSLRSSFGELGLGGSSGWSARG